MKKALIFLGTVFAFASAHVAFAACTPVSSTFPNSLDTFVANDCIPSSWANTLESTIGTTTATSSLVQRINSISGSTATTTITASGTLTGPSFTFGTSTTITPVVSGTAIIWNLINTGNWAGTWQGVNSSTFLATNTGNWAGTWQGVNSTTFYLATNPSNFASALSTVANYAPFWTSSASTTLSASSSLYLNNSQVAIGTTTFNGLFSVVTNSTTTNAMTIDANGNVFFGSATDTSQSGGVSSTVSFMNPINNNQDSYVDFVNRASGKGEYFLINASSSFENIRVEDGAYISQWDLGMFGSTAFSIYDDVDGTTPFTIAKGAPTNSFLINASGTANFGGHIGFATTAVTLVNCGGSGSSVTGSDNGGFVTLASSTQACTVVYSLPWLNKPVCDATIASGTDAYFVAADFTTSTVFTANAAMATSSQFQFRCQGNPN